MKKLLMLLPVLLLFVGTAVQAQDPVPLPTVPPHTIPPFVYHFDPVAPVVDWVIPAGAGPAGAVGGPFADGLAAPGSPWHWETEWHNPGAGVLVLPIIFRAPGLGARAGLLTLAPGARVVIEWVFNEVPEVGGWVYTMTPPVGNPLIHHDASVCEADIGGPPPPPVEWEPRPEPEIKLLDHYEVVVSAKIPTVSTWGIIILVLLLLSAATLIIRRRRVEA